MMDGEEVGAAVTDFTGLGGIGDRFRAYTCVLYGTWDLTHV